MSSNTAFFVDLTLWRRCRRRSVAPFSNGSRNLTRNVQLDSQRTAPDSPGAAPTFPVAAGSGSNVLCIGWRGRSHPFGCREARRSSNAPRRRTKFSELPGKHMMAVSSLKPASTTIESRQVSTDGFYTSSLLAPLVPSATLQAGVAGSGRFLAAIFAATCITPKQFLACKRLCARQSTRMFHASEPPDLAKGMTWSSSRIARAVQRRPSADTKAHWPPSRPCASRRTVTRT